MSRGFGIELRDLGSLVAVFGFSSWLLGFSSGVLGFSSGLLVFSSAVVGFSSALPLAVLAFKLWGLGV